MKQKRTIYSLLLTSFMLVFAFSYSFAQEVTFDSPNVLRCSSGNTLDITVDSPGDISAFEVVFEVSNTSGGAFFDAMSVAIDPGISLGSHIVDLSGVDNVSPDTVRIAGMMIDVGDACLAAGQTVVATVTFTTNDDCDGTVTLNGITGSCPSGASYKTQFVDCSTSSLVDATVNPGVVTFVNTPPVIDPIADASVHWGTAYVGDANATDADEASCENLTYTVSGPAGLSINAGTGVMTWPTTGADVCTHNVEVVVTDACGAADTTSFEICVYNDAPTVTCPTDLPWIIWGDAASGGVTADDPDGGPSALSYSVASFNGPGTPTVDANTGDWEWQTMENNSYLGCFELAIAVTDGANICSPCSPNNADTCVVEICVLPTIDVTIEKTHGTIQGQHETVSIYLDDSTDPANEMGGYDLLIQYDASALSLTAALPGQLITDCGWEYFTYRYGPNGNCGPSACPSGVVRLVAIAEYNNGQNHPSCFSGPVNELAVLDFLVTNDRTLECMYIPIQFVWYDCGDNAFSSVSGDTLFISRHVYSYGNPNPIEADIAFPSFYGANSTCDVALDDGKPDPIRLVDFQNGGIDIVCADSIDARGDINLNEIANEIADAVLFSNYFIYGISVFDVNPAGQTAATDVNADGLTLTVADLVYLIRVIVGDALAYPKEITNEVLSKNASYIHAKDGMMSITSGTEISAAYMVVEGNVTPQLLVDNMDMKYAYDGANTRVLVYSMEGHSFSGEFLNVSGNVMSIEMATREGNPVELSLIPTEFALKQNYPNPFNPTTSIDFSLPEAGKAELSIYNINGQKVAAFAGEYTAGAHKIEWDAAELASGVYFYKLVAGNFTDTKKMVLLK
jgi:hypothetical protein